MIIELDMSSDTPIYVQLRNQIVKGIGKGEIQSGEKLPTVRQLAADAGVNTMTVNKTYQILMLMCDKVTHKHLIDNRPLFRYYSSIWIEKTSLIQYNKVSGRYLYEGKNTNH